MDCRLIKPVPFSREARLHAEIPTTPVNVRVKDIKSCYSQVNEKLVLGQRHSTADPKKSRKQRSSRKASRKGGRRSKSPGTSSMGVGEADGTAEFTGDLGGSVSMLSISSVIDEFKSLMSQEVSASMVNEGSVSDQPSNSALPMTAPSVSGSLSQDLLDSGSTTASTINIAPLRSKKKSSKYEFEKAKLYCRFPKCNREFKRAFELYLHTRKEHGHLMSRPFKEPVGVKATRPHTTGAIDPFHKRPPSRTNCSGVLPAVPRSRPPSPDATGVVWPVEVLQQQTKWQEAMDAELLREHARELQLANMKLTMSMKQQQFSLNKSQREVSPHKREKIERQQLSNK